MEAPDKFYIKPMPPTSDGYVGIAWTKKCMEKMDEYIRKDTLLEWAKAEIKLSKRVECVSEKSYEEGRQRVAQNLIDKLNSM